MVVAQALNKPVLQRGSTGAAVKELQNLLNILLQPGKNGDPLPEDGIFGADTDRLVRLAQDMFFLTVDGVVGQKTWQLLFSQRNNDLPVLQRGSRGDLVRRMQQRLAKNNYAVGTIDGEFGPKTEAAVKQVQSDRKLSSTGIVNADTWKAISTLPLF